VNFCCLAVCIVVGWPYELLLFGSENCCFLDCVFLLVGRVYFCCFTVCNCCSLFMYIFLVVLCIFLSSYDHFL
jgi:hypothetical protein